MVITDYDQILRFLLRSINKGLQEVLHGYLVCGVNNFVVKIHRIASQQTYNRIRLAFGCRDRNRNLVISGRPGHFVVAPQIKSRFVKVVQVFAPVLVEFQEFSACLSLLHLQAFLHQIFSNKLVVAGPKSDFIPLVYQLLED